ncbi:uncharacterized protein LOC143208194 [Lasioglossum baleicum]|uniref:uncharacterized protein LOC143208194 n=1 Tax=Lasioglossum baleicum TaxID=434251 RepID=UPI003FCE1E9D
MNNGRGRRKRGEHTVAITHGDNPSEQLPGRDDSYRTRRGILGRCTARYSGRQKYKTTVHLSRSSLATLNCVEFKLFFISLTLNLPKQRLPLRNYNTEFIFTVLDFHYNKCLKKEINIARILKNFFTQLYKFEDFENRVQRRESRGLTL